MTLSGAAMSLPDAAAAPAFGAVWAAPFVGLLLSIALLPLVASGFWHRRAGSVALFWSAAFVLPFALQSGVAVALHPLADTLLREYLPFVLLLAALYTTAGGIHLRGELRAAPGHNTAALAVGALLASVMGTTGASMLLIRPLLRANAHRPSSTHVVVFFIFIVGNIGGALTPLGDPPLLLGYLRGVGFFWTTTHLLAPMLFLVVCLLTLFHALDLQRYAHEARSRGRRARGEPVGIDGRVNLVALAAIVGLVAVSAVWAPGGTMRIAGVEVGAPQLWRDGGLVVVIGVSLLLTPPGLRAANDFSWAPMREVAQLFAGLFVTMIPVLAMLSAGESGAFAGVLHWVATPDGHPRPWAYFWATGALSSFLDNAPTYLVFFQLAGGDARTLMTTLADTLAAMSAAAVFMGANTYIGNAPNFMIKAIAERHGVPMPGFFGYMGWSGMILLPLFLLVAAVWFR